MNMFRQKSTPFRRQEGEQHGNTGGQPKALTRLSRDTPIPMAPRITKGRLKLPRTMRISFDTLVSVMNKENLESGRYAPGAFEMVKRAYKFAEEKCAGKTRKSREGGFLGIGGTSPDAITHQLTIAIRAGRFGQSGPAICAALLHDEIEDHKVLLKDITEIFEGCKEITGSDLKKASERVIELVLLLTKPKLISEGRWIFPDNPNFFEMEDNYTDEYYDLRAEAYYSRLLKSGDMVAIFLKILDNIQNAESMRGISNDAWRQRNLRTMLRYTMDCAFTILPPEDVTHVREQFTKWGFRVPQLKLHRTVPDDGIVILPSRAGGFNPTVWARHPLHTSDIFLTVYWDIYSKMAGFCEVGFPPNIIEDPQSVLRNYLKKNEISLSIAQGKSLVPESLPAHEKILVVSGFSPISHFIRPSDTPGRISILNASRNPAFDLSASALTEETFHPADYLATAIGSVDKEFSFFINVLRRMFKEQIADRISFTPPPK